MHNMQTITQLGTANSYVKAKIIYSKYKSIITNHSSYRRHTEREKTRKKGRKWEQ